MIIKVISINSRYVSCGYLQTIIKTVYANHSNSFWNYFDIAAGIVLAFPNIGILTVVFILSIALLLLGIERLVIGIFSPLVKKIKQVNIGLGILAIIFSIIALAFPIFAIEILILIISFALMFIGITRILHAIKQSSMQKWLRIFSAGSGIFSIILSVLTMISPTFGLILLDIFVSFALLVNGFEMIFAGISGGHYNFGRNNLEDMR
jgi:uncharacterized membrane protein HdeD (DUF308 family)